MLVALLLQCPGQLLIGTASTVLILKLYKASCPCTRISGPPAGYAAGDPEARPTSAVAPRPDTAVRSFPRAQTQRDLRISEMNNKCVTIASAVVPQLP